MSVSLSLKIQEGHYRGLKGARHTWVAAGVAVGGTILSTGAATNWNFGFGGGGGGGAGGGGGYTLPSEFNDLIKQITSTELPQFNVPNISYNPTNFDLDKYISDKSTVYKKDKKGAIVLDGNGNKVIDKEATAAKRKTVMAGIYGSKVKPVQYRDTTRPYTPTQSTQDLNANVAGISKASADLTAAKTANREAVAPGSQGNMDLATNAIGQYLQGVVPGDVVDFTNRQVADRVGGTFNPFAPDKGQMASNQFARAIGTTSLALQQYGIGANAQQQQLADNLSFSPNDAIAAALGFGNLQSNANQLTKGVDENRYTANLTNNYLKAAPNPQLGGYMNDKINLINMNNANQLAADQFNWGTALQSYQTQYQSALDQANLGLAGAQLYLGAAPSQYIGQGGNQGNAALAALFSGASSAIGNIYGNYTAGRGPYGTGVTTTTPTNWNIPGPAPTYMTK